MEHFLHVEGRETVRMKPIELIRVTALSVFRLMLYSLWYFSAALLIGGGIALISANHTAWGVFCALIGTISVVGGLYWSSPRLKSDTAKRSFVDFGAWLRGTVSTVREASAPFFVWFFWLAIFGAVAGGVAGVWKKLDNSGWIPHHHVTPVWIQGDWMPGEYRVCQMRTKTGLPDAKGLDSLAKLPRLFCGENFNGLIDFQVSVMPGLGFLKGREESMPPDEVLMGVTSSELARYFHDLPVTYWGRIDRTDKLVIAWRCQRNNESLTCKALN
jgi:hypothetical protein